MIGGMQGHTMGDAAWHREQLEHKIRLDEQRFADLMAQVSELAKQRNELKTALAELMYAWRDIVQDVECGVFKDAEAALANVKESK